MREFITGTGIVMEMWKEDAYRPFACAERINIAQESEVLESSTADSGAWVKYKSANRNKWRGNLSGVMVMDDEFDVLWFFQDMMLESVRGTLQDVRITFTDSKDHVKQVTGQIWIVNENIDGDSTQDDFGRWSMEFIGNGPIDLSGIVTPPTIFERMRLEWITTGAEPNAVQSNALIGLAKEQILEVSREGDDKFQVIDVGVPNVKQVRLDAVNGKLIFSIDFDPNEFVWCLLNV